MCFWAIEKMLDPWILHFACPDYRELLLCSRGVNSRLLITSCSVESTNSNLETNLKLVVYFLLGDFAEGPEAGGLDSLKRLASSLRSSISCILKLAFLKLAF